MSNDNLNRVLQNALSRLLLNRVALQLHSRSTFMLTRVGLVAGPWFPDDISGNRLRGQASLAIAVASDPSRKSLPVRRFESLMFNSGTIATKESLFCLWSKLCSALGQPPSARH